MKRHLLAIALGVTIGLGVLTKIHADSIGDSALRLSLRSLHRKEGQTNHWQVVQQEVSWEACGAAVVICDMWDKHWCKSATARVAEMAPHMNKVISELRRRGVLIIHCPSDTMKYYEGAPGRRLAQSAPKVEMSNRLKGWGSLDSDREPPLPIDDSDGGCPDEPKCKEGSPWTHEIESIEIAAGDAITDSSEAYYLMHQRGITNVIVMGVHENMCVLGRPFAIRQMVGAGQNVVLMRDMTDCMYNPRMSPKVDHFTGIDLVEWHIEKYWCPSITSDQIVGGKPFRFAADMQPPREYHD